MKKKLKFVVCNRKYALKILMVVGFIFSISIYIFPLPSTWNTSPFQLYGELIQLKKQDDNKHWYNLYSPSHISNEEIIKIISNDYPNLAIEFWKTTEDKQNLMYYTNSSCSHFPDIFKLELHNTYWQVVHMTNHTNVQLYSAYYDDRAISGQVVRILSMVNRTLINFPGNRTLYCQFWFDNETQPVITPMDKMEYMWIDSWHLHSEGLFGPYLLGCSVPESHRNKVPRVVSFVENPCDIARNMLSVIYNKPAQKKEFTVCVKGMDFLQQDLSLRLVEWIELVLQMGADKIHMYELEVHPNIKKVLNYYTKLGKVDVRPITLPSGHPTIPLVQHLFLSKNNLIQCLDEIIPYNDCFYRNIHSYDYVAIFDTDEIILPLKDYNWHDLIERTKGYDEKGLIYNGFTARHIYYLEEMQRKETYPNVPFYMTMMQHVYRARNFTGPGAYVKTIYSTNTTLSCHNHWPISVAPGTITREFHLDEARMQHYRKHCPLDANCTIVLTDPVKDTRMWDFKEILVPRVNKALKELGFME